MKNLGKLHNLLINDKLAYFSIIFILLIFIFAIIGPLMASDMSVQMNL